MLEGTAEGDVGGEHTLPGGTVRSPDQVPTIGILHTHRPARMHRMSAQHYSKEPIID
jgi:hypothetical protein